MFLFAFLSWTSVEPQAIAGFLHLFCFYTWNSKIAFSKRWLLHFPPVGVHRSLFATCFPGVRAPTAPEHRDATLKFPETQMVPFCAPVMWPVCPAMPGEVCVQHWNTHSKLQLSPHLLRNVLFTLFLISTAVPDSSAVIRAAVQGLCVCLGFSCSSLWYGDASVSIIISIISTPPPTRCSHESPISIYVSYLPPARVLSWWAALSSAVAQGQWTGAAGTLKLNVAIHWLFKSTFFFLRGQMQMSLFFISCTAKLTLP